MIQQYNAPPSQVAHYLDAKDGANSGNGSVTILKTIITNSYILYICADFLLFIDFYFY